MKHCGPLCLGHPVYSHVEISEQDLISCGNGHLLEIVSVNGSAYFQICNSVQQEPCYLCPQCTRATEYTKQMGYGVCTKSGFRECLRQGCFLSPLLTWYDSTASFKVFFIFHLVIRNLHQREVLLSPNQVTTSRLLLVMKVKLGVLSKGLSLNKLRTVP